MQNHFLLLLLLSTSTIFSMEYSWKHKEKEEDRWVREEVLPWASKLPPEIQQHIGSFVMAELEDSIDSILDKLFALTTDQFRRNLLNKQAHLKSEAAVISPTQEYGTVCLSKKKKDEKDAEQTLTLYHYWLATGKLIGSITIDKKSKQCSKITELAYCDNGKVLKLELKKGKKRAIPRYFNTYSLYELNGYKEPGDQQQKEPSLQKPEYSIKSTNSKKQTIAQSHDYQFLLKNQYCQWVAGNPDTLALYNLQGYCAFARLLEQPNVACAYALFRIIQRAKEFAKPTDSSYNYHPGDFNKNVKSKADDIYSILINHQGKQNYLALCDAISSSARYDRTF